jgi:very-short-patch-repair endonuclease
MYKCESCDKSFKSSRGLTSHYRCHDPLMVNAMREYSESSRLKATKQFSLNAYINRLNTYTIYTNNCNTCKECSCCLLFEYRSNKFCSSKCAAIHNNKIRKEQGWSRTEESKQKVSITLKNHHNDVKLSKYGMVSDKLYDKTCVKCSTSHTTHSKNKKLCQNCANDRKCQAIDKHNAKLSKDKSRYSKIIIQKCTMCDNLVLIRNKKTSKTCSKECYNKNLSIKSSERLKNPEYRKNRYGRHKRSYMETSFSEWLISNGIKHKTEEHFYNHEINKHYFADFYFEASKLIIELDGTQHRHTVENDAIRDEFLTRFHGFNVVRITHKQYIKNERLEEIKNLLGIH